MSDTIFALSSGQPPAAIGVIRISGPQAGSVLRALAGRLPVERRATLASISDPIDQSALDSALLLWFPGAATATGEDLAEIHCHGGRAVTAAILRAIGTQTGCRLAEPGEFTRRAFQNGRIDLNEAEGLSDLLFAETESQRRAAIAMAQGHFSKLLDEWQARIIKLSALVEAALDFSDEDDVPVSGIDDEIRSGVSSLLARIEQEQQRPSAERLRDGITVVIAGPPNAGKSTLLNALARREAAIVSHIAGTTRDKIEVAVSLDGIPFLLTDTAGLRDGADEIEAIGIDRARVALEQADIILWLGEPNEAPPASIIVAAQADMAGWRMPIGAEIAISAVTAFGMDQLIAKLKSAAAEMLPKEGEYALHARQRNALDSLAMNLREAVDHDDMLITAEMLRVARSGIDRLTGRAGTEDMLDALFGKFCIGK